MEKGIVNTDQVISPTVRYRTVNSGGMKIFYREAGEPNATAVLLLHGFPTSSHMFRGLIPLLADRYHMIAPDLPGFGFTQAPQRGQFKYTFDNLAGVIDDFPHTFGLYRFAIYVLDYDSYTLDSALLARPGNDDIQLDLFLDYANNVALYPKFQEYFRTRRPPLLAVWGNTDPFFLPAGAKAFTRDNPDAEVHFYDTGHFALETHVREIADAIREFLGRKLVN